MTNDMWEKGTFTHCLEALKSLAESSRIHRVQELKNKGAPYSHMGAYHYIFLIIIYELLLGMSEGGKVEQSTARVLRKYLVHT
jgi:hypothetical protein